MEIWKCLLKDVIRKTQFQWQAYLFKRSQGHESNKDKWVHGQCVKTLFLCMILGLGLAMT